MEDAEHLQTGHSAHLQRAVYALLHHLSPTLPKGLFSWNYNYKSHTRSLLKKY